MGQFEQFWQKCHVSWPVCLRYAIARNRPSLTPLDPAVSERSGQPEEGRATRGSDSTHMLRGCHLTIDAVTLPPENQD
jgi:hypothetical protein